MNRGVEIADDVADDPHRSLILEQVRNGVPTRMAVLELLMTRKR
jgi:aspartate carbamoyltransferase catalytic subunit